MCSKLKLKVFSVEGFIEEIKSNDIEDVRIGCFYNSSSESKIN